MTTLVFVHGWASGEFVWDSIINEFDDYKCHMINLGFIGDKNTTILTEKFIGIGHSLGGSWLLKNHSDQMTGFISIASFNCFYKHLPKQVLEIMKRNAAKNISKQMMDFWNHAGLNQPEGFQNLHPTRIIDGLNWLSRWDNGIPKDLPIKVLASKNDHIVPENMTRDIWSNHDIEWIEDGGHMLPLTKAEWCIKHIKDFINEQ